MAFKKKFRVAVGVVIAASALALTAAAIALYALQTNWFRQQVRERILIAAETSTGGRVEIGAFNYNWHTLTAQFADFTIHGAEPQGAGRRPRCCSASRRAGFHARRSRYGARL